MIGKTTRNRTAFRALAGNLRVSEEGPAGNEEQEEERHSGAQAQAEWGRNRKYRCPKLACGKGPACTQPLAFSQWRYAALSGFPQ